MSTMITEVYDALISANADDQKARAAATALAEHQNQFAKIDQRFTHIDGRLTLLQWMVGFNLAFTMAIVWKVFS